MLARAHGFRGDRDRGDAPGGAMLDLVLERRRGRPIVLGVVYVEVARRAGIPLAGVGPPGRFACAHVGGAEVLLVDPFDGGRPIRRAGPPELLRPWTPRETALRVLSDLVAAYGRRGDLGGALRAADLRLLVAPDDAEEARRHEQAARTLRSRLN